LLGSRTGEVGLSFYDDKKNTEVATAKPKEVDGYKNKKNLLACVTIAPDGSMTKQMHPQQDAHFRMMLEKSVTGSNDEVYYLAIKTKKAFRQSHLLNHAKFHLGEVTVGGPHGRRWRDSSRSPFVYFSCRLSNRSFMAGAA